MSNLKLKPGDYLINATLKVKITSEFGRDILVLDKENRLLIIGATSDSVTVTIGERSRKYQIQPSPLGEPVNA